MSAQQCGLAGVLIGLLAAGSPLSGQVDSTGMTESRVAAPTNQIPDSVRPLAGTVAGLSVERWVVSGEEEGLTMVALHVTRLPRAAGLGVDFALAVPPEAVAAGCFLGVGDLGPAFGVQGAAGGVQLRTGVSALAGECGDGGGAIAGFYAGLTGLLRTGRRTALRLDVTSRRIGDSGAIMSIGIGLTSLPGLTRR